MCTYSVESAELKGSAKGAQGWFPLSLATVAFDHPAHAQLDHALLIDFMNPDLGMSSRVAVELTRDSARELVKAIQAALESTMDLEDPVPAGAAV